ATGLFQLWTVDADGNTVNRSFTVTSHGCAVSPDGRHLVCEAVCTNIWPDSSPNCKNKKASELCDGFWVLPTDGSSRQCVWRSGDWPILGVAIWSPDSKGFAYYAVPGRAPHLDAMKGVLLYYRLGSNHPPIQLLPRESQQEGWIPTEFCSLQTLPGSGFHPLGCQHLGVSGGVLDNAEPSSNLGSEMPTWSGDRRRLTLYVAAVDTSQKGERLRRTLGSITISCAGEDSCTPGPFQPLMRGFTLPVGYPATSLDSSGHGLVFLGATSVKDARSQLYMFDPISKKVTPLTNIGGENEVFGPVWR